MSKSKYFILLFAFFVVQALQTQTIDSSLGVYPLQVDNVWQYWMYDFQNGQVIWIYGWTTKVVSDTLMPDGKLYFVLKSDGRYGENGLLRQESNKVVTYSINPDLQIVIYDFSKTVGDTIWFQKVGIDTLFCTIQSDNIINIFGENKRQQLYYIKTRRSTEGTQYYLVDGFGVSSIHYEPGEIWNLRGAKINGKTYGTITSINNSYNVQQPTDFELFPNYPNPFNPTTTISFIIPQSDNTKLIIYDYLGREVKTMVDEFSSAGLHNISFDAHTLASGVYFYKLISGKYSETKRMLLIK